MVSGMLMVVGKAFCVFSVSLFKLGTFSFGVLR